MIWLMIKNIIHVICYIWHTNLYDKSRCYIWDVKDVYVTYRLYTARYVTIYVASDFQLPPILFLIHFLMFCGTERTSFFRSVKECLNGKIGDIGCPSHEQIERTKPCFFDECPHYSEWYSWSLCSKSCGGGVHQRHRTCKHGDIGDLGCPIGQDKGRVCFSAWLIGHFVTHWDIWTLSELMKEHQKCEEDPCPHWGSWTRWSPCDKKCGRGYQIARRGCEYGYKNLSGCRGPDLKRKLCFKHCKATGFSSHWIRSSDYL